MTFLDEQLDNIYITENLEKALPQIKSKSALIIKSIGEGNLFQARKLLNTLPDASLEQMMQSAHKGKNFHKYHMEAKRKVKGDRTEMQKIFILTYGTLKGLRQSTKDITLIQAIDEIIISLYEFADKYSHLLISEGFTLSLMMRLISFFFNSIPVVGKLVVAGYMVGAILFWFGILLMVVRLVLNTYFSLKGIK
jgi:hypothetical protein